MQSRLMNRLFFTTLALIFVATTFNAGCSSPEKDAKKAIETYVVADAFEDREAAAEVLVAEDREIYEAQEEEEQFFETSYMIDAMRKHLGSKISVNIDSTSIDGDTMTVSATITLPDESAFEAVLGDAFNDVDIESAEDEDEVGRMLGEATDEALKDAEITTVEEQEEFTFHKEDGKWLLYLNLAREQAVTDGAEEATELGRNGDYDEAFARLDAVVDELGDELDDEHQTELDRARVSIINNQLMSWAYEEDKAEEKLAHYRTIVEIDPDWDNPAMTAEEAQEEIAAIEAELEKQQAQIEYTDNITISNLEVSTQYFNQIEGELKNDGDQPLDSVVLAYSLLDDEGNEVSSDSYPVVSAYGDADRAMQPGHEKSFTIHISDAPSSWSDEVDLRVSRVEFFEER